VNLESSGHSMNTLQWKCSPKRLWANPFALALVGSTLGLSLWLLYTYVGFARLPLLGLASVLVLLAGFQYPIALTFFGAFGITANLVEFVPGLSSALFASALVLGLAHRFARGTLVLTVPPIFKWLVLFVTWQMATILWSESYDWFTFSAFYRNLLIVSALIVTVQTRKQYVGTILAAGLGMVFTTALTGKGIAGMLFGGALAAEDTVAAATGSVRFYGHWQDPNIMALTMIPFIGMSIAVANVREAGWQRMIAGFCGVAGILNVMVSLSRGAILCLGVMLTLIVFAYKYRRVAAIVFISTLVLVMSYLPVNIIGRMITLDPSKGDLSVRQRSNLVFAGFRMIADSFPLGLGPGNFRTNSVRYADMVFEPMIAHNTYIEVMSETGLIGALLFGGMLFMSFANSRPAQWRIAAQDFRQTTLVCMFSVLVAMSLGYVFLSMSSFPAYWFALVLISMQHTFNGEGGSVPPETVLST
jgi:hypothetical protein